MKLFFTDRFKKRFDKLPAKVKMQFEKRVALFIENPVHPTLRNHPLKNKSLRADSAGLGLAGEF